MFLGAGILKALPTTQSPINYLYPTKRREIMTRKLIILGGTPSE